MIQERSILYSLYYIDYIPIVAVLILTPYQVNTWEQA